MSLLASIQRDLNTNQWVVDHQTAGLSHEDGLLQLPFQGNCLNWVLGHVTESRIGMLDKLGKTASWEKEWTEEWRARYRFDSEPVTDGSDALPLETLLEDFKSLGATIQAALEGLDEASLEAVIDEKQGTTLGQSLHFSVWHEAYHVGQTEFHRQLAGKNDKVI
jgi:uncharacterized damage-inducible protein DinB